MNFTCAQLLDIVGQLKKTIENPTLQQQELIKELEQEIVREGKYYHVESLTVDSMRENGYDVTEDDSAEIERIAGKIVMDQDELWRAVEVWSEGRNLKRIEDDFDLEESEEDND